MGLTKYYQYRDSVRRAERRLEYYSPVRKDLLIGKAVLRLVKDELCVCFMVDEDLGDSALRSDTLRAIADWLDELNE